MSFRTQLRTRQAQVFRFGHLVSVLQMSAAELDEHLAETAQDNPFLVLRSRRSGGRSLVSTTEIIETVASDQATSLQDHVLRQLAGPISRGGELARIIIALVEELEPSGWLGRPLAQLAAQLGLAETVIEAALSFVQRQIEPAGLFARDLSECLRLQLQERDQLDDPMRCILDHLPALEKGGVDGLARASGLPRQQVRDCLATIRRLDPKPGARFETDPTLMRAPDVTVERGETGWSIRLNASLECNLDRFKRAGRSSNDMQAALAQARNLKQALVMRRSAMQQIMRAIVARQEAFFLDGHEAIKPLTMTEIATATGFHLSTVSRVLDGLLIEWRGGIIAARDLCARRSALACQNGPAKPRVVSRIRALLRDEDPLAPLSDRRLSELLVQEGIAVSRRVVTKYRQEIGAAPATSRVERA